MILLKILSLLLSPLLLASEYTVKSVEILPLESYPAKMTVEGITVAVDPYPDDEKSSTAFDVDNLNSRGFFPVHVIIKNESPYYLKIRTQTILLETRLGERLYSTPAAMVIEDLIGKKYVDSMSSLRDGDRMSNKVTSRVSDFTTKELSNTLLEPGKVRSGFLFFFSEKHKRSFFIGSKIYIPSIKEEGTDRTFGPFEILLDPALDIPV